MEEEQATIESQFFAFAKLFDSKNRTGETITLYNSDYWLRQSNIIDDRKVTMTDTGILFNEYGKSEITRDEWLVLISQLCVLRELDEEKTLETLVNCGLPDTIYCNATYDGYLCWPPTPAGETTFQKCPSDFYLIDKSMQAYRRCGADGLWVGRHINDTSPNGWTNYTPCFPEAVQNLLSKVGDKSEAQLKFETAVNTRTVEMIGIVLSIVGIMLSLYIFSAFPSLHNRRTLIHRNLFCALLLETTIRMLLYTQQAQAYMLDKRTIVANARKGIENLPYVCEGVYVLLEYARLSVYAWMFIEGVFLNTMISANTLRNEINVIYFYFGGWVIPTFIVGMWATLTGRHFAAERFNTCWFGYNYLPAYYIINGPIVGILIINTIFLVTVLAVIITKLRRTNDSELEKVKKAIRATLILLPLLGIINIFNLFEYPLEGSSIGFAIWAYVTHFFRSFQGLFISIIYCFTNDEVLKAVKKRWDQSDCVIRWRQQHQRQHSGRTRHIITISDIPRMDDIPMTVRQWDRPSSTNNVNWSEVEAGPSHYEEQHTATVHVPTDNRPLTDFLSSIESVRSVPIPPRRCSCESAPSRYHYYHRRSLEAHEAYTKDKRRCSLCELPCRRYSQPYDRPRDTRVRAMSCVPSTHTIPRTRRGFTRPGLVTRDSRMGLMSISSCL